MNSNFFSNLLQSFRNQKRSSENNIYLCSFVNSDYQQSAERLKKQAESMELFTDCFYYNETNLPEDFVNYFSDYLKPGVRGFGYFVWKPLVILESLKKIKENDILFYVDTGCHLNIKGKKRFLQYLDMVNTNESGFVVTDASHAGTEHYEYKWTKGDILDYFDVRHNKEITHTIQYQAGIIFIRKNPETVSVIEKWMKVFYENMDLINDSPSVSPNSEGFIENRHDQSILSIILKKHGATIISANECYCVEWKKLKKYPILIKRDLK